MKRSGLRSYGVSLVPSLGSGGGLSLIESVCAIKQAHFNRVRHQGQGSLVSDFFLNLICPMRQYHLTDAPHLNDVFNRAQDAVEQARKALQCVGLLLAI